MTDDAGLAPEREVLTAILIVLGISAWRGGWFPFYLNGLRRGGWWMIGLAFSLGVIAGAGISFDPDVFWKFFTRNWLLRRVFLIGRLL